MTEDERQAGWRARAIGLAILGASVGFAFDQLTEGAWRRDAQSLLRPSLATFLVVGGLAFAFTIERVRPLWAVAFGVVAGLLVASISYWNGPWDDWNADEPLRFASALLTVAIAAPFVQLARDRGRATTDYPELHAYAWSNVVVWLGSLGFALIAYALAHLLAELFALIGIRTLRTLLRESWFGWLIAGGAFGGAIGLLRDNDRIVRLLQRVAVTILSVLAPVLAAGLVLFLLALPFTGLQPLWDSTRATTPILLTCVAGALVLIGGVIGGASEEEARSPILRTSALALALAILPLAAIAAISTGSRVAQRGMSPERLWATLFVAVFVAVGAAYLWAVAHGRMRWPDRARAANVRLALGLCALAALLATPLVDFGALSARDQLARLASGKTSLADFDFQALRFDFGPAGLRALDRLAANGTTDDIRRLASDARKANSRSYGPRKPSESRLAAHSRTVRILPAPVPLPIDLRDALFTGNGGSVACDGKNACVLFWRPGETRAVALGDRCESEGDCRVSTVNLHVNRGSWTTDYGFDSGPSSTSAQSSAIARADSDALRRGEVEIRSVPRRQVFIGGRASGSAFE